MLIAGYNEGSLLDGTTAVGGAVGVKLMQEQLRRIAFESGKSKLDPAKYDGTMTLGTIIALATTAPLIGKTIHPVVGDALRVVDLIKAPIKLIPYGGTVIDLVLSPWIIDEIYGAILGIIRLVPGGGGVASGIDGAVKSVKTALAAAAAPIAAALALFKPTPSQPYQPRPSGFGDVFDEGLGAFIIMPSQLGEAYVPVPSTATSTTVPNPPPGYTWVAASGTVPGHWERARAGQTGNPSPFPGGGSVIVRDCRSSTATASMNPTCAPGGITVTPSGNVRPPPMVEPLPGQPGVVRDHRDWPHGKAIIDTDWGGRRTFQGLARSRDLAPQDLAQWDKQKNTSLAVIGRPDISVRNGAIAFKVFEGRYEVAAHMGAFWDERTNTLTIKSIPKPSSSGYPFDFVVDAVVDAADAIAGVAQDTWNWIADNADDVYRAVKKYGCMIVNNDIVVALAATGAGIVASPAASAAVVTGASAGKAACAAMEIAEALYAIYKLLSMDFPKPVPLTSPTPPAPTTTPPARPLRPLMPLTPPVTPLAKSRYPQGSITAFDVKLQRFRIAIPVGTQVPTQLQDAASAMLGATAATHFEVAQSESAPAQVPVVPLTPFQRQTNTLPLYKNPLFWTAIGAGAVAVGGGGYVLYRRRRRLTA